MTVLRAIHELSNHALRATCVSRVRAVYSFSRLAIGAFALLQLGVPPAFAQDDLQINPHQPEKNLDLNGIDYVSGTLRINRSLLSYGDPQNPLSVSVNISSPGANGIVARLSILPEIGGFQTVDGMYMTYSSPLGSATFKSNSYWFAHPDTLLWALGSYPVSLSTTSGYMTSSGNSFVAYSSPTSSLYYDIKFADGEIWHYFYKLANNTSLPKFILSNRGYGLQLSYDAYGHLIKITFYNKSYVYCDESLLNDCASVSSLPTAATITNGGVAGTMGTVTYTPPGDAGFQISLADGSAGGGSYVDVAAFVDLGVAGSTRTYTYAHWPSGSGQDEVDAIASINDGANTWTYHHDVPGAGESANPFLRTGTDVTDPLGHYSRGDGYNFQGVMFRYTDENGRMWNYGVDTANYRKDGLANPEWDTLSYGFDDRGNATSEYHIPKLGSTAPNIVRTALYPTTCTNLLTCNKPTWVRDAKGNQTDFTYDPAHGGVLTRTGPADANGVRPQTRYTYVQRYAWILNSSGGYVHAESPIWLPDSESFCRASAATGNPAAPCTGNDEVKTSYEYGPDSGPNNLFLRGKAVTADGITLRTCYGNDANGRRISETSPRGTSTSCP